MHVPHRAVIHEWQYLHERLPPEDYGAISLNRPLPVPTLNNQLFIDRLLELEENQASQFTGNDRNWRELSQLAIGNANNGSQPTNEISDEFQQLYSELEDVWNIVICFVLTMLGTIIFVTIIIFVKVRSSS
jgi:hypothetical protein